MKDIKDYFGASPPKTVKETEVIDLVSTLEDSAKNSNLNDDITKKEINYFGFSPQKRSVKEKNNLLPIEDVAGGNINLNDSNNKRGNKVKNYFGISPEKTSKKVTVTEENNDIQRDNNKRKVRRKKKRKISDPAVRDVTQLLSNNLKLVSPGGTPDAKNVSSELHVIKTDVQILDNESNESIDSQVTIKENKLTNSALAMKNAFHFMMESRNRVIGHNSPGKDGSNENIKNSIEKAKLAARRQVFSSWADKRGSSKRKRLEQEKDEIINHKLKLREKRLKKMLKVEDNTGLKCKRKRIMKISSSESDTDFEVEQKTHKGNKQDKVKEGIKKDEDGDAKDNNKLADEKNKKKKEKQDLDASKSKSREKSNPVEAPNSNIIEDKINKKEQIKITATTNSTDQTSADLTLIDTTETIEIIDSSEVALSTNIDTYPCKVTNNKETVESIEKKIKHKHSHRNCKHKKCKRKLSENINNPNCKSFTPRTLKLWKMKIKINGDKDIDTQLQLPKSQPNYKEISSSDDESARTISLSSDSETERTIAKTPRRSVKLAPIFTKSVVKPKEDPAIAEARKQFLMSGIPSSLKKTLERQNSIAEQYQNDSFPITYHIQQKSDSDFWNFPGADLQLQTLSPLNVNLCNLKCENLTNSHIIRNFNIDMEMKKLDKLKELLNKIKQENPHYPVYKAYRQIRERTGGEKNIEKTSHSKRKRGRKKKPPAENTESQFNENAMWTEKYKPRCSDDIIGNGRALKDLKKWLETWKNFSQEICSRKRRNSNKSESDFESTDGDSMDTRLPGRMIILSGPCGSGKSTAVYAVCNEVGLDVIELNASSKRTGKWLLQELQEATQSHQVRQGNSQTFHNFFQSNSQKENLEKSEKKMCVILIEDIDIVFDQDEGFISALMQLATSSKRPIITTTTDISSIFVQKFLNQCELIQFSPLSAYSLGIWLQIVALCEGLYISLDELSNLLEYNKGDVRKTLLQLQYWVLSGGQIIPDEAPIKINYEKVTCDEELIKDDACLDNSSSECNVVVHKQCMRSFEICESHEPFVVPYYINLGLLWWNIPRLLDMPDFSKYRTSIIEDKLMIKADKENIDKLYSISKVYDSLVYTDRIFKKSKYFDTGEPLPRQYASVKDSLELNEVFGEQCTDLDFMHELTHRVVNGSLKKYITNTNENKLNFAVPVKTERKWRTKLHEYENTYQEALLMSTEGKAVVLDYMPALRNIGRSESSRAATNTKRGNRFRNYLKDLGVRFNESTVNIACRVLHEDFI